MYVRGRLTGKKALRREARLVRDLFSSRGLKVRLIALPVTGTENAYIVVVSKRGESYVVKCENWGSTSPLCIVGMLVGCIDRVANMSVTSLRGTAIVPSEAFESECSQYIVWLDVWGEPGWVAEQMSGLLR